MLCHQNGEDDFILVIVVIVVVVVVVVVVMMLNFSSFWAKDQFKTDMACQSTDVLRLV